MSKTLPFKSDIKKEYYCLPLLVFLFSFQNTVAANFYVNDIDTKGDIYTTAAGHKENHGTSASPKISIFETYEKAQDGDTIIIDTGSYADLSKEGKLLFAVTKKVTFVIAGVSDPVFSKNPLPKNIKVNPTEIYIDNDKPIDRETYMQKLRNNGVKKS